MAHAMPTQAFICSRYWIPLILYTYIAGLLGVHSVIWMSGAGL